MNHNVIFKLNPTIVVIRNDIAYDAEGNEVQYDLAAVEVQAKKDACKAKAKFLLAASDWSSLSDVGLANQSEFVAYRSVLRGYVINPVENPTFPTEPQPVWS